MKKTLIIIGSIVLGIALLTGSFFGGMYYQNYRSNQVRTNFLSSRGLSTNGLPNGTGNGGGQRSGLFGGGVTGQVKSIDGNVITVSTAQNVTTVDLSSSTTIVKTISGATSDLQTGQQIMVTGQRDSNGVVSATQILILNTNQTSGATP